MRGKKAKTLRLKARKLSIGLPARQLLAKHHNRTVVVDGRWGGYRSVQVFNDPNSTRGIYRKLKNGVVT